MKQHVYRYGPAFAAAILIVLCLAHWGQLTSPYIEHDDWDFLLPPGWGHGFGTPWSKTLSEGRWLNYLWYLGIGAHWSPQRAARTCLGLSIVFAGLLGFGKDRPWTTFVATLVLFFSPSLAWLSTWPSGVSASAFLLALGTLCLRFSPPRARLIELGVFTFLSIMAYSGIAPLLLLAYVYFGKIGKPRQLITAMVVYLACFGLSVLAIALLNYYFHAHFGLKIENWRQAHPPADLHDVWIGALHELDAFVTAMAFLWSPCLIWAFAVIVLLRSDESRGLAASLVAVAALALATDVGLASLSGLSIPFRTLEWVWPALLLPMLLLATTGGKDARVLAWIGMLWMLVLGVGYWNNAYQGRKPAGDYVYALAKDLSRAAQGRPVVLVGDLSTVPQLRVMFADPTLQVSMALRKIRDITASPCEPSLCEAVKTYAKTHRIGELMFEYQGREIVYFRPGASNP